MKSQNPFIERLLYIALAVVLMGAFVGLGITVNYNRNLQGQLKALQQQTMERSQVGDEIKSAVSEIKADQDENTQYLICIAKALSTGKNTTEIAACKLQTNDQSGQ